MGIWDTLGNAVIKLNDYAGEKLEEIDKYKEKYARLKDRELMNEFYKNNGLRQFAIAKLLDERGYEKGSDGKWH